jgi:hypothetical protein
VQLVFDGCIELVSLLLHLEVELQNLLCHLFFFEITVVFEVDKLCFKHTALKLHAPIRDLLLVLLRLAELILQTQSHPCE